MFLNRPRTAAYSFYVHVPWQWLFFHFSGFRKFCFDFYLEILCVGIKTMYFQFSLKALSVVWPIVYRETYYILLYREDIKLIFPGDSMPSNRCTFPKNIPPSNRHSETVFKKRRVYLFVEQTLFLPEASICSLNRHKFSRRVYRTDMSFQEGSTCSSNRPFFRFLSHRALY